MKAFRFTRMSNPNEVTSQIAVLAIDSTGNRDWKFWTTPPPAQPIRPSLTGCPAAQPAGSAHDSEATAYCADANGP